MTQRTLSNLWMPRARKRFPFANRPYSVFMKDSKANAELQGKGYFPDDLKVCLADKKPFMYRPMAQLAEEDDGINGLIKVWPESRESVEMGVAVVGRLGQRELI